MYFHWEDNRDVSERICAMYMGEFGSDIVKKNDGVLSEGFKVTRNHESGGAGLAATVDSYSLVIDALCGGGAGANGARILSEESVKKFMVPSTSRSPVGEFGWDGAAGAYVLVDPVNQVSIFYAQHIVGFPIVYGKVHPVIRDLVYEGLDL